MIEKAPKHFAPPTNAPASASPEPKQAFNIALSVPDEITIRMVDASALSDYEMWVFLASMLSSAAVGFIVPYVQSWTSGDPLGTAYFWIAALLTIGFAACLGKSISIRMKLTKKGREIKLRTRAIDGSDETGL
jgi:hypothetical protein